MRVIQIVSIQNRHGSIQLLNKANLGESLQETDVSYTIKVVATGHYSDRQRIKDLRYIWTARLSVHSSSLDFKYPNESRASCKRARPATEVQKLSLLILDLLHDATPGIELVTTSFRRTGVDQLLKQGTLQYKISSVTV